jgi:hypothetical protein
MTKKTSGQIDWILVVILATNPKTLIAVQRRKKKVQKLIKFWSPIIQNPSHNAAIKKTKKKKVDSLTKFQLPLVRLKFLVATNLKSWS